MLLIKSKEEESFKDEDMIYISILHHQVSLLMQIYNMINNILENERAKKDLLFAAEMQQNFFPENTPEIEGVEIYGECKMADKVGGDYYDYWVVDNKLFLVIADVSGHSLAAAILMSTFHGLVQTLLTDDFSPGKTFKSINNFFIHAVKDSGMFCTAFIGVLDLKTRELVYSNAAHPYPILYNKQNDSFTYLDTDGIILGVMPDADFEEKKITIKQGDMLMMFTDGLIEVFNKKMDMFELNRLTQSFLKYKNLDLKTVSVNIFCDIKMFAEETPIKDDMTIIVTRF